MPVATIAAAASRRVRGVKPPPSTAARFPIGIHSSRRCLCDATGAPLLVIGDSPYSLEVQLTVPNVDIYVANRKGIGFNAALFEAFEHKFSSQSPADKNANGDRPFSTPGNFSTPNEPYWVHVDYIINALKAAGIIVFMTPMYFGFGGGAEGWTTELNADTTAHLQTFGAFLANRYTQGNIIWVRGGDHAGDATLRAREENIYIGMRTVRTTDIICSHPQRGQVAYNLWGPGGDDLIAHANFLNTVYCAADGTDAYSLTATEYNRAGPYPVGLLENGYEGERTLLEMRRSLYAAILSGACYVFFGNNPLWGFGEPNANGGGGAAAALASSLNTTGAQQVNYLRALLSGYAWQLLQPKTTATGSSDTYLVTTPSLGSGASRICPAVASDGSFAMIYSPGVDVTVDMSAITHASVRARLFDPTAGTYSAVGGSPFANTGAQAFTIAAESVLVLD